MKPFEPITPKVNEPTFFVRTRCSLLHASQQLIYILGGVMGRSSDIALLSGLPHLCPYQGFPQSLCGRLPRGISMAHLLRKRHTLANTALPHLRTIRRNRRSCTHSQVSHRLPDLFESRDCPDFLILHVVVDSQAFIFDLLSEARAQGQRAKGLVVVCCGHHRCLLGYLYWGYAVELLAGFLAICL